VSEILAASIIALMLEAARTYETLANFYQTTRRYNPEDSHLRNPSIPPTCSMISLFPEFTKKYIHTTNSS
jgi:hypothetical protein